MPIGYGSKIDLPALSNSDVGVIIKRMNNSGGSGSFFSWSFWTSIGITAGEIALTALTEGAAAPILVAGVASIAQTGVEYAENGKVSLSSGLINAASFALPTLSAIRQGIKGIKLAKNSESLLNQLSTDLGKDINSFETSVMDRIANVADYTSSKANSLLEYNSFNKIESVLDARYSNLLDAQKNISSLLTKRSLKANELINTLNKAGKIGSIGGSTGRTLDEIDKIQKIYETVSRVTSTTEQLEKKLKKALEKTGATAKEIAEILLKAKTNPFGIMKLIENIFAKSNLSISELRRIYASIESTLKTYINLTKKEILLSTKTKMISKVTKSINMIMSPSALAGEVISKTIAKISAKMEEQGAKIGSFVKKIVKAGAKTVKQIEDEFVKTGGQLINSSWILGYKLLKEEEIASTILIQFKITATKSNSGINTKGKKPVIVTLTNDQIKNFIESSSKGQWYLNNIARSRGGRYTSELGFGEEMATWLGFLPVDSINEVVGFYSLGSGFSKNIKSGAGTFIWQPKEYAAQAGVALITASVQEGIKSSVSLSGVSNQYFRQTLEGTLSGVVNHQSARMAVSNSFKSSLQSYTDATFEDSKNGRGQVVKQTKKIQGGISGFKGITG